MKWTFVTAALAAIGAWLSPIQAYAYGSSQLDVEVMVTANLSVSVSSDGINASTQTVNWSAANPNQALVSASTIAVINDSGAQTEKWALNTTAISQDQGASGAWTRSGSSTSVGMDGYSIQAVFGSSNTPVGGCPSASSDTWNGSSATVLGTSLQTYGSASGDGSTVGDLYVGGGMYNNFASPFPDVTSGAHAQDMYAGDRRTLCWRIVTPNSIDTGTDSQTIPIIITAQNP